MDDKRDIRWAAGLFEGEGWASVDVHRRPYGRRAYEYTVAGMQTTDKDVAETFVRIMGGNLYGPYKNTNGVKPMWAWRVRNEAAKTALRRLLPYMGKRRTAQIEKALSVTNVTH